MKFKSQVNKRNKQKRIMNHDFQKGSHAMPAPSSIAWNPSNAGTEETAPRLDLLTKSMVGEYSHLKKYAQVKNGFIMVHLPQFSV